MEERPRANSALHIRPAQQTRTNKILQSLSQFKGLIRISGRKARDDRDAERFPYPSQMDFMRSNTSTKPSMSQPHLGLERRMKNGHHDSEVSKLSGSSERLSGSRDETPPQRKPSINQDFPLRTHPRSSQSLKESDPPLPRLPSPTHSDKPIQPPTGTENTIITGSGTVIDGLPPVMDPMYSLVAQAEDRPTTAPVVSSSPRAQPESKRPSSQRRPSTATSTVTTSSNATTVKAPGPLLKLKRSFSQLRLNSFSKQQSDVTSPNSGRGQPPPLPSPKSTSTPVRSTSPLTSSPSPVHVPNSPTSTPASSTRAPPTLADTTPTPISAPTSATTPHPQLHYPNMIASGALAPMSLPKPMPPHSGNLQRRAPAQPPKLSLPPVNHRISLTIPPALTTDDGPVKFSPTIISRPMPLPILNLPTLTSRSDSLKPASGASSAIASGSGVAAGRDLGKQKAAKGKSQKDEERRAGKQHLKSMPALPIQGTGRGVKGHEETDDMEDDDESADDDDELDEEEDSSSSRLDNSRSGFLAPDMSEDSFRSGFDSSMGSIASSVGLGHSSPPSTMSGATARHAREGERERTSSSGSSYHSALSGFHPNHPPSAPEFAGLGIGAVPILKEPTPPRRYFTQHNQASLPSSSSRSQLSSSSQIQPYNQTKQGSLYHNAGLPEVDTSKLDLSFLSTSSPTIAVDVKGKGKARDLGSPSAPGPFGPTAAIVTGGTARTDYNYDPSKTPTASTPASSTISATKYAGTSGGGNIRGPVGGSVPGLRAQGTKAHSHLHGQSSMTSAMTQSPTGTIKEVSLHYPGSGGGDKNGSGDYFTAKGFGTGSGVIAGGMAAGATSSPRPVSAYYHTHSSRPPLHSPSTSYTSYPHSRHSVALSPSPQVQTPKPGVGGMRTPGSLFSAIPTPRRSSTLYGPGGGYGQDVWSMGSGIREEGQAFSMPKMYKRASQSLIDLHTIETKEMKRLMEEEARAEEDMELEKLREREKEKEKEKASLKDRSGIVKEVVVTKEREKRRSTYDKIKEDDGDEDEDDEEAVAEKRDQLAPEVPSKVAMSSSPIITTATAAIATNVHDDAPPAFSSISMPAPTAATKKQNRLSTASHYLRRRRSMPMYDETSEPPPYPSFAPYPPAKYKVMPREDEGRERLPPYTNPVYLKAIMPRKIEFIAPGVQAKDRKWRRMMVVLEGTVLRVYKCPPGYAGVGVLGEWWEKQVGAGDVSLQPTHAGGVSNIQIETRESRRLAEERRDIERQIQRIMKSEDESGVYGGDDGEPDVVFVPAPAILVQEGAPPRSRAESGASAQTPTMSTSSSSRSKFTQFLKPGTRHHSRSKSDHVHPSERNTPSQSPRPSLNIPSGSGATTPGGSTGGARSPSPFAGSVSTRAQTPMSSSSLSIGGMDGRETPTSSTFSSMGDQQQQWHQLQQQQKLQPSLARKYLYSNRERDFLPDPDPADLVREYTLQHAESGIGNDYLKRKNVIRLRLEGEQFLLQARDVTGVVEWIEALQAATNIALDLDERPMPRGPLFPRRRRRRRPQTGNTNDQNTAAGTSNAVGPPVATV